MISFKVVDSREFDLLARVKRKILGSGEWSVEKNVSLMTKVDTDRSGGVDIKVYKTPQLYTYATCLG